MAWNALHKKKTLLAPSEIKEIKHSLRGVTFAPHHILQYSGFKRLFRMTRSVWIIFLWTPPRDKINEFPESRFFHFFYNACHFSLVRRASGFVKNTFFHNCPISNSAFITLQSWKSFKGWIPRRAVDLLEVDLFFFFFLFSKLEGICDFMQMSGNRSPCLDKMQSFCLCNIPCLYLKILSCHC